MEQCQNACLNLVANCDAVNYDKLVHRLCSSRQPAQTSTHSDTEYDKQVVVIMLCACCVLTCRDNGGKCGFEQCDGQFKYGGTKGSYAYVYVAGPAGPAGPATTAPPPGSLCSLGFSVVCA